MLEHLYQKERCHGNMNVVSMQNEFNNAMRIRVHNDSNSIGMAPF